MNLKRICGNEKSEGERGEENCVNIVFMCRIFRNMKEIKINMKKVPGLH